jgi:hypothetical protein
MTGYKTRTGIILTEIAGEHVLVAAKSLLKECPYITQINESSAFLWEQMEQTTGLDDLVDLVTQEYELDDLEKTRLAIKDFIQKMIEMNLIEVIKTEEKDEKN